MKKKVILQRTVHDNRRTVWVEFMEVEIEIPQPEHDTAGEWHVVGDRKDGADNGN